MTHAPSFPSKLGLKDPHPKGEELDLYKSQLPKLYAINLNNADTISI